MLQLPNDLDPIPVRHEDVGNDHIRRVLVEHGNAGLTIRGFFYAVASSRQYRDDRRTE